MTIHDKFQDQLADAERRLRAITEQQACTPIRDGAWSRKQVLGHLIDSSLNNHQRFVRASLQEEYEGPGYEQEGWVRMHAYDSLPWTELVDLWASHNRLLTRVTGLVPESKYEVICRVGHYEPMTLLALMEDYLVHMRHHLNQIHG